MKIRIGFRWRVQLRERLVTNILVLVARIPNLAPLVGFLSFRKIQIRNWGFEFSEESES